MKTGDQVQAKKQIDELGDGGEYVVHARVGDIGQVVDVFPADDGAWLMVAWEGGACQCHTDEVESAGSTESAQDNGSALAESEGPAPVSGVDLDTDHGSSSGVDLERHEGV